MHDDKKKTRRWRAVGLLAVGVTIGTVLMATPAAGHIGSVSHLWNHHIKPKADARYDRPTVKKLETIRGTVGDQFISPGAGEWGFSASLPRAARVGLDDAHVTIDGVDEASGECPGTSTNPTAKPGYVCIYPYSVFNMTPNAGYVWGSGDGTKWGFTASIEADGSGESYWIANWAYKGTNGPVVARSVARTTDGCSTTGEGGC